MAQVGGAVLITGGSSGIGMGLAGAFHARGAKVIIAGRDGAKLKSVAARFPGMETAILDVRDPKSVQACAKKVAKDHPDLDTLINNAGIQARIDFTGGDPVDPAIIDSEIDTNFRGLVHVTNAFLPLLQRQPSARIVQVSSALAYVPLVAAPVYCATKAAVHSFAVSLRWQLRKTRIRVIELIPPLVATGLHDRQGFRPPNAMELDKFVEAAMAGLESGGDEIAVGRARVLRLAARFAPGRFLKIINAT